MELRNEELSAKIKQDQDDIDAKFEVEELKEKCLKYLPKDLKTDLSRYATFVRSVYADMLPWWVG